MKKILASILAVFLAGFAFAESLNDGGNHSFDFEIAELAEKGFHDEVKIQNGSTFVLTNIQLKMAVNGKSSNLLPIAMIQPGRSENFDGYKDDDLDEELLFHFGKDGKISKKNTNKITFEIDFGENNKKVTVKNYYIKNKDIYFLVENAPELQSAEESGRLITVNGKKIHSLRRQSLRGEVIKIKKRRWKTKTQRLFHNKKIKEN